MVDDAVAMVQVPYLAVVVLLYEDFVDIERAGARWEAEDEGLRWRRSEVLDSLDDVVGYVRASLFVIVSDDESHLGGSNKGLIN